MIRGVIRSLIIGHLWDIALTGGLSLVAFSPLSAQQSSLSVPVPGEVIPSSDGGRF